MTTEPEEFPFDPTAEFVWMIHDEGTVPARFPAASVPSWRVRGWNPCEAPTEIDPALIEYQPAPTPDKKTKQGVNRG